MASNRELDGVSALPCSWHYDRQEAEGSKPPLTEPSAKTGESSTMKKQPSQVKKVAVKAEGGVDLTAHLRKMAPPPAASSPVEWSIAAPPAQMEA